MPIPVSLTLNKTSILLAFRRFLAVLDNATVSSTLPRSVNLIALLSKLLSTCTKRMVSV